MNLAFNKDQRERMEADLEGETSEDQLADLVSEKVLELLKKGMRISY